MKMQKWLNARCAQLLTEINNTPFTDDCDEIKLQLIMSTMRETSVEMFHRAAENSRKEIEKINNKVIQEAIYEAEIHMSEADEEEQNVKSTAKANFSSSVIRRGDSF